MGMVRLISLDDEEDFDLAAGEEMEGLAWAQIESGARIVWSHDDQPMRALAPRSKRRIGRYNSIKAGRLLAHESRGSGYVGGEKLALMLCEIDPDVADLRTQHLRFDLLIDGSAHSYVPDIVRLMADGTIQVIEVKKDGSWQRDAFYAEKIRCVREVCAQVGVPFAVWTEKMVAPNLTTKRNIVTTQEARTVEYDDVHQLLVVRALKAGGGAAPLGALKAVLADHGPHTAEAMIRGMMCRRVLMLPLCASINDDTLVTIYTGPPPAPLTLAA